MPSSRESGVVEQYILLGLSIGRHIPGFVDAYYGPQRLRDEVDRLPIPEPDELLERARRLIGSVDAGEPLGNLDQDAFLGAPMADDPGRRSWIRSQLIGLFTSARLLCGEQLSYVDEVELCYGVRPTRVPEDVIVAAHRNLEEVVPGSGALSDRLISWRESMAIPVEQLDLVIHSLADDLRERTNQLFELPEGEAVAFELVRNEPWSGFNYYLGDLRSTVAINIDLPVLSTAIAHLVAHEAYPGHHTEHTRKETGLVRTRRYWEESIFLVGTPQCLISEGLADLGLEVVIGRRPEAVIAEHLRPFGIDYDPDVVAVVSEASEALSAARANAAFRLYEDGAAPEVVADELARFALLPSKRAEKAVEFLTDPTWRSYISCYVEGLPLCRTYVSGHPERFERLISEQLTPADLIGV